MSDDLDRLLSGLCDGRLSDAEQAALGERLAADAAARSRYLDYLDLHAALSGPIGVALPDLAEPVRPRWSARGRWFAWATASAALVLAGLGLWTAFPPKRVEAPLASIVEIRLVEFGGRAEVTDESGTSAEAREGNPVKPGQTLRTDAGDGYAVLDFGRGSWLQLSPDAQLRFAGGSIAGAVKVILLSGVLRGEVDRADDLTVVTPGGEFHPNGSRFLISANAPNVMETEVPSPAPAKPLASFDTFAYWGLGFAGEDRLVARLKSSQFTVLDPRTPSAGRPVPDLPSESANAGLSGDGSTFFTVQKGVVSVWNTLDARERRFQVAAETVRWLWAISHDGSTLAAMHHVSGPPIEVRFWNTATGEEWPRAKPTLTPRCLALSADGRFAAWGIEGRRKQPHLFEIWDVAAGRMVSGSIAVDQGLRTLAFSPDSRTLAGATEAGTVHRWDCRTGRMLETYLPVDSALRPVSALAFAPNGSVLASGRSDGRVDVWSVESGREILAIQPGSRTVSALSFSPSGRSLAVGLFRQPTTVWAVPPVQ
jgi:WD40 repeat protein